MRYYAVTRTDGEEVLGLGTSRKAAYLNAIERTQNIHGTDLVRRLLLITSSLSKNHSERKAEICEITVEEYRIFRSKPARTHSRV
jgi:hypothetical protein